MKKPAKSRHEHRWEELYGAVASSNATVECEECGYTVLGDGGMYYIVCLECWNKYHKPDPIGELMDAADRAKKAGG